MRIIIAASSFKLLFAILVFSPGQFLVRHFDISCFASAESSHLQAEYSALIWIGECSNNHNHNDMGNVQGKTDSDCVV